MKLKRVIGVVGISVFAAAWASVVVGLALGVGRETFTVLVIIAAFATELLFWCVAALLGLTVFQARRRIWSWLTRPFQRSSGES